MTAEAAVFLHIHKTAGTTLNQVITRQYAPGTLVDLYGAAKKLEAFKRLPEERKVHLRLIRGHIGFGIHEFMPMPVTYFTLLRNPIEQTISQYSFLKSTLVRRRRMGLTDDETYRKISAMTLADFVADAADGRYDNPQTRALAGSRGAIHAGIVTEEVFDSAIQNLSDWFPVVGFVEEFERSLLMLKRRYSWSSVFFIVKNPTKNRPDRVAIEPELVERIRGMNEFDSRLYGFSRQLLAERSQDEQASLDEEVRTFRATNASLRGRMGFFTSTAISKAHRWLHRGMTLGRREPLG